MWHPTAKFCRSDIVLVALWGAMASDDFLHFLIIRFGRLTKKSHF
jgi:hypothetical protein